jgi:electron transport complex protein RnfC
LDAFPFIKARRIRGIKIPHRKHLTDSESVRLRDFKTVTIPVSMHIGAPAKCTVSEGQQVFVGSVIGEPGSFVSAYTHSSVSGTVKKITSFLSAGGSMVPAVEIESDGNYTPDPSVAPPEISDPSSLVSAVRLSGCVGLGGAGFPTHVKLSLSKDKPHPDYLLINGAECEGYITSDARAMVEDTEYIKTAVEKILDVLDIPACIIGIEKNKPAGISALKQAFSDDTRVTVRSLGTSFPQGAEKVLIANLTGRAVPAGGLPADAGAVVLNVSTAAFLGKYFTTGMPLVERRITVDGKAISKPGNYIVPIGAMIGDIAEMCGGYSSQPGRILLGGTMQGIALWTDSYPVHKNNNAVLFLTGGETDEFTDGPCIHCGRCVSSCPMGLSTVEIVFAYNKGDLDRASRLGVMNCIECGCCSFVCPAGRPLTQYMRLGKAAVKKRGKK